VSIDDVKNRFYWSCTMMHGDELDYEISAKIFEESDFVAVFQAGQKTCLVDFTVFFLNKVTQSCEKQTIAQWYVGPSNR